MSAAISQIRKEFDSYMTTIEGMQRRIDERNKTISEQNTKLLILTNQVRSANLRADRLQARLTAMQGIVSPKGKRILKVV